MVRPRSATIGLVLWCAATSAADPWPRHTIDDSSRGADGTKLMDVNADGLLDIATGWEEGGAIRVCLHPGFAKVKGPWPAVTVASVGDPEDAVFGDFDGDGRIDVLSSSEGMTRALHIHWAPKERDRYLEAAAWKTRPLRAAAGRRWMFAVPVELDGRYGIDVIAGSKDADGAIGWFASPPDPRKVEDWTFHKLRDAGWIMSLLLRDIDGDGDQDLVFSDRKGKGRGCYWLENPGVAKLDGPWKEHVIGATDREVMFACLVDLDRDGALDLIVAAKPRELIFFRRIGPDRWEPHPLSLPAQAGTAKGVAAGDTNGDGTIELVFSCEGATDGRDGVMGLSHDRSPTEGRWRAFPVSGPDGIKYDLVELLDLDGDGDLDVLTSEEGAGLGVVWYENRQR